MKGYKLTKFDDRVNIVNDDSTWTTIKKNCGKLWDDYQAWLKQGNKPEVYQTSEEISLSLESNKKYEMDQALKQSVKMRSELEIQGDEKALEKSQAWYQEKVTEIEAKFS